MLSNGASHRVNHGGLSLGYVKEVDSVSWLSGCCIQFYSHVFLVPFDIEHVYHIGSSLLIFLCSIQSLVLCSLLLLQVLLASQSQSAFVSCRHVLNAVFFVVTLLGQ